MSKDECFSPRWSLFLSKNGIFADFGKMENHAPIPLPTVKNALYRGRKVQKKGKCSINCIVREFPFLLFFAMDYDSITTSNPIFFANFFASSAKSP